uniref:BRL3 n=1 Tax=Arundo donax TaxID=35708 RepID=A0A0A8YE06_ARUDO
MCQSHLGVAFRQPPHRERASGLR